MPKFFRKRPKLLLLIAFLLLTFIFYAVLTTPSNNRDWQDQYNVLPQVNISEKVTINNIRDWKYEDETTISKDYINRTIDPKKINKVWFVVEPFGGFKAVAHTYFIFDLEDESPIAISIEARREESEDYSGTLGLFNRYELIYIWATEEDQAVRRAVLYKDKLHMYPLNISRETSEKLFIQLAKESQKLETSPRFYNTLTSNCTNELAKNANKVKPGTIPFSYSLLPGYSAESLYKLGLIDNSKPLEELRQKYYISDFVQKNYKDKDFSKRLRGYLL
jgi:hypothetical protein